LKENLRYDAVYTCWIQTVPPSIYNVKIRKGASKIELICEWEEERTVNIQLSTPQRNYAEQELDVIERTNITMNTLPCYQYIKKTSLKMKPLSKEENWRVQLNLSNFSLQAFNRGFVNPYSKGKDLD